ncbi:hypothetical protein [uncultured Sulfitobacter sp.]|uniref:hypothetical protein n=1 Tax=uncultured Sulfitobacter sp. TaxID=191468 RepID=UPI002630E0AD|nr:hypothetical protein [uncultured Sulfitobacter sp.]
MAHNQISYTVSPAYFHEFKFRQFGIDTGLHNRIGASLVGFMASWWMGLVIGVPIYIAALFVKGTKPFVKSFVGAALLVVATTLLVGIAALVVSFVTVGPDTLPPWMRGRQVSDPVAFARAGTMHNFSYLGGLIGLFLGLIYTIWQAVMRRRAAKSMV